MSLFAVLYSRGAQRLHSIRDTGLLVFCVLSVCTIGMASRGTAGDAAVGVVMQDGWCVSRDLHHVLLPLYVSSGIGNANASCAIVLVNNENAPAFRALPFGDEGLKAPIYLQSYAAWAADSLTFAYFAEYLPEGAPADVPASQRVRWRPVVGKWDVEVGAMTRVRMLKDFGGAQLYGALRVSPSGRYILTAASVNRVPPTSVVRLWEPETASSRELLRIERPSGWTYPFEIDVAWDKGEENVYLAVGYTDDGGDVEKWTLCKCLLSTKETFTPSTAKALFVLKFKKRGAEVDQVPFIIGHNLQVLGINERNNSLVFYRGDTYSYWSVDLTSGGGLHEEFPSPFAKRIGKDVGFNEDFATTWTWRDCETLAVVRKKRDHMELLVANARKPEAAKQVAKGNIREWYVQWPNREWLAYRTSESPRVGEGPWPTLTAVNIRTGERKVLITKAIQDQIARDVVKGWPAK
jgi:hypothetical protein